jgi:hypothetical protein
VGSGTGGSHAGDTCCHRLPAHPPPASHDGGFPRELEDFQGWQDYIFPITLILHPDQQFVLIATLLFLLAFYILSQKGNAVEKIANNPRIQPGASI